MTVLEHFLGNLLTERHFESTYELDASAFNQLRVTPLPPQGLQLDVCEYPLLPKAAQELPIIPDALRKSMAFGVQLTRGVERVASCRSNGLATAIEFMVDVGTPAAEDRQKGYATLVATRLIDLALERELQPLWETTEGNTASRRLASKLGFVERETYPVYAMRLIDPEQSGGGAVATVRNSDSPGA